MALVVFLAVGLWLLGAALGSPKRMRWVMIGFLLLGVVALHLGLPDGHPLRMSTAESAAPRRGAGGALLHCHWSYSIFFTDILGILHCPAKVRATVREM